MPRFAPASKFARDLRRAGHRYFRSAPTGRYADRAQWARAGLATLGLAASAAAALATGGAAAMAAIAAASVSAFLVLATMCHDAAHGSFSRHAWVNRAVITLGFGMFGISGQLWRWRHVHLHHMFPNVAGTDIDGEGSLLVRLAPGTDWHWWYRLQPLYAPVLYALVFPHLTWLADLKFLRMTRAQDRACRTPGVIAEFAAVKLIHAGAMALFLAAVFPGAPLLMAAGYFLFMGIASVLFVVIVAGTHLSAEAEFFAPEDGRLAHGWAEHQLLTSVDWLPQSRLAVALTGGANAHSAHHLFPEAAHCHTHRLSRLVAEAAARHGLPHHVTSFAGMLRAHLAHLAEMARPPFPAAEEAAR